MKSRVVNAPGRCRGAFSLVAAAHAQDYPKRPITMIVPFAAGGTSDVIARVVAEEMTKSLGQPIVIENVAGAGGSTALTRAARAEADGYTIAIGNAGTSAATYTIYPKLPFTPESFAPIAVVAKTFGIVALRKDFPAKNLQDFIAYAKKNPGKVNLGHAGVGSSNFLICKSFAQAAGIDVTLVGYRGAAPALTDAIGGQIDGVCDSAASVSQAIDDKLVRGLVVGSTVRLATLPDLPTSAEAGLPDFEAQGWNGLFAPKGTPPAIIAKLNAAAKAAVESEAVKKRFHDLSTVAPDANELAPRSARPTGDARRREIQEAAGREEVARRIPLRRRKLLLMEPCRVPGRALGSGPFLDHVVRDQLHPRQLFGRSRPRRDLEAMAAGIPEIDRLEDRVIGRPDDIETSRLRARFGFQKLVHVLDLQRNVLGPLGRIGVFSHRG